MSRIMEILIHKLRRAADYNREVYAPPACILWPDGERQWEAVIPRLQLDLPGLFMLGEYNPEKGCGPAIWLRCVIAGKAPDLAEELEAIPILYLPGVGRQELRDIENCPEHLKPLVELQYRGATWSQVNGKDWTILAFLKSDQGGLGLRVGQDRETKSAMQLAIAAMLEEEVDYLRHKHLDKDFFNTLLTGGDPVKELLQWLDQGDAFKAGRDENQWKAFVELCKSQFVFDPEKEGPLAGAAKLADHQGPWQPVWDRFCQAPVKYAAIPERIRKCSPPDDTILWLTGQGFEGWPQWNDQNEQELLQDLLALQNMHAKEARQKVLALEKDHQPRRQMVWAELGRAPLALALEHLAVLAGVTSTPLAAGTTDELKAAYLLNGWQADDALVKSLAGLERPDDLNAVCTAIRALYLPWAEEGARHLQDLVEQHGYPGGFNTSSTPKTYEEGTCLLFVDGLRLDMARRLAGLLVKEGMEVKENPCWAALPTVTATGKPAVSPVRHKIDGDDGNSEFEPVLAETGQPLKGGHHFKKLLEGEGWESLESFFNGTGTGKAWCEGSNLDHTGHNLGWKLTRQVDSLLQEIMERIRGLLATGWKTVHVITDHGWLLMPGGLPKIELPAALVDNKWGRCAAIKTGALTEARTYPWFWHEHVRFALAEGINCYRKGTEYTHGGLSLQECLTLELIVTAEKTGKSHVYLEVTDVVWKGLRCKVAIDGSFAGLRLDLRLQAGDGASSVVLGIKEFNSSGVASVVVENEDLEGRAATLVILDHAGELVAQVNTVIGGEGR